MAEDSWLPLSPLPSPLYIQLQCKARNKLCWESNKRFAPISQGPQHRPFPSDSTMEERTNHSVRTSVTQQWNNHSASTNRNPLSQPSASQPAASPPPTSTSGGHCGASTEDAVGVQEHCWGSIWITRSSVHTPYLCIKNKSSGTDVYNFTVM